MNLSQTKAVVEAYRKSAEADDVARLDFFQGIWEIQERHEAIAREALEAIELPGADDLVSWFWSEKPFIVQSPVPVDSFRFAAAAKEIAAYLVEKGQFGEGACEHLKRVAWRPLIEGEPLELAGSDPEGYLEAIVNDIMDEEGEDPEAIERVRLTCMVLSLALRTQLEPYAELTLGPISSRIADEVYQHMKPLSCPVCGCTATLGAVGPTSYNKSNVRTLYCGQCGSTWAFERIRCAHCGHQHQENLEYVSLEGDDAHRAYLCSECGGYTRTYFYTGATKVAFSPLVEDIMMVKLDALAAAGQLKAAGK